MKRTAVILGLVLLAGPLVWGRDPDFDRMLSELELNETEAPTRGWRSLLSVTPRKYYGCMPLGPNESYTGTGARITTVQLASVNTTAPALETCCKLCYFVKQCRKFTFKKKIDGIDPEQVWSADCTLYKKTAKKISNPLPSQYFLTGGVVLLEAPGAG